MLNLFLVNKCKWQLLPQKGKTISTHTHTFYDLKSKKKKSKESKHINNLLKMK